MTTKKQIQANRRNVRKSTGPKTSAGKGIVRFNALKHGLRSEKSLLLPGEDSKELDQLMERIQADLQPVGELENILVEQIIACIWRLRRINQIETGILAWEYYGIQAERAERQARSYERDELDMLLARDRVITDERSREEALRRARKAREIQESEIPTIGLAFSRGQDNLFKVARYQSTVERSLYRALHELDRLQADRRSKDESPPVAVS